MVPAVPSTNLGHCRNEYSRKTCSILLLTLKGKESSLHDNSKIVPSCTMQELAGGVKYLVKLCACSREVRHHVSTSNTDTTDAEAPHRVLYVAPDYLMVPLSLKITSSGSGSQPVYRTRQETRQAGNSLTFAIELH
jgi:hypothetical protein